MGKIHFNEEIFVVEKTNSATEFFVFIGTMEYSFTYRDGLFITNDLPKKYHKAIQEKLLENNKSKQVNIYKDGGKRT